MAVSPRWSTARRTSTPASRAFRRCRSAELDVRPIGRGELDAVSRDLSDRPASIHRERLELQEQGDSLYLIAWSSDRAVGHVFMGWSPRDVVHWFERRMEPWIRDLWVPPEHRRRGIGRALMDRAEKELRSRGFDSLWFDTGIDEGYAAARALYEDMGYRRASGEFIISARIPAGVESDRPWVDIVFQISKRLP
jgi:GNAT superfamily N-acetyltransferase